MGKIEEFKEFVKKNPKLLKYVNNGEKSWQNFYEIYDIYGESEDAWKDYVQKDKVTKAAAATAASAIGLADVMNWLKNVNLDSLQSGIGNIQRVLGVVTDLSGKDDKKPAEEYKPRPMYKHFED